MSPAITRAMIAAIIWPHTKHTTAATMQPPTVSPAHTDEAAKHVAAHGPSSASAKDQIAHEQAKMSAGRARDVHRDHRGRRAPRSATHPARVQDYRAGATRLAHQAGAPYVLIVVRLGAPPSVLRFASRAELDAQYHAISDHHDQYAYVAAFDLRAAPRGPVVDSVGVPAAEHAEVPSAPHDRHGRHAPHAPHDRHGAHAAHPLEPAPHVGPLTPPSEAGPSEAPSDHPPEAPFAGGATKWSTGKIVAIAAAVVAGGVAIVYGASRKPRKSSASRSRRSSVIVASPTPMSALRT